LVENRQVLVLKERILDDSFSFYLPDLCPKKFVVFASAKSTNSDSKKKVRTVLDRVLSLEREYIYFIQNRKELT